MASVQNLDIPENGRRKRGDRRKQRRDTAMPERRHTSSDRRKTSTRRAALRMHKNVTARFQLHSMDLLSKWDIIFLRNIGPGGVLFQLNQKLEVGAVIKFMISFPSLSEPIACKAKVVRVHKPGLASVYEIAAHFTEMSKLNAAQIQRAAENFYSNNLRRTES